MALDPLADAGFKASMVDSGASAQYRCQLFGGFATWDIDNRGAAGGGFKNTGGELVPARLRHLHDFDGQVMAAEAVNKQRWLLKLKLYCDIFLHGRCGGGREGDDGCRTQSRQIIALTATA